MNNSIRRIIFAAIIVFALIIRLNFSLTTPLLETDGAIALLTGRVFNESGIISLEGPSAAVLNGLLYKIFGESILIAKLGDTFSAIGIIIICYFFALKAYNSRVALLAIFFITFSPLNILFSIMAKPYMILSFFITLSAYLLYLGISREKYYIVVAGGLCIPIAFGFRTFSMFCLLGISIMAVLLGFINRNEKGDKVISFWYPLTFVVSSLLFLSPILVWRISKVGIFFFRDFGMPDWLKSQDFVYIQRWENVEHHHLDSAFLFFPAFLLFTAMMFRDREKLTANLINFSYAFSFIFLLIINPGHHFPRILVPAISFLCIMSAYIIDYFLSTSTKAINFAILIALTFSPGLYIFLRLSGPFQTEVFSQKGVIKMLFFISISFVSVFVISFITSLNVNLQRIGTKVISVIVILSAFAADGFQEAEKRINILSEAIIPYIAAIEFAPPSGKAKGIVYENNPFGILEGKDSKDLRDIELKDGLELLSGNHELVSEKYGFSYFIIPMYKYADGIFFTYRDMSNRHRGEDPKMHEELLASNRLNRIYDNSTIICLQNPFQKLSGIGSRFTDRAIPVRAFMGRRGENFVEIYFGDSVPETDSDFSTVVLNNRGQRIENFRYIISFMDSVIEAESFYPLKKSDNLWFSAYSHWSVGMPFMRDYFSNNTAMVFPLLNRLGSGTLYRRLQIPEGRYGVYARLSLPKVDNGEIHMNFLFDNKPICEFDGGLFTQGFKNIFLGEINVLKGKENLFEIKASGKADYADKYILFDRLILIRKDNIDIYPEKCPLVEESPSWEISKGRIILSYRERKSVRIPENYNNSGRVEFLAYSPSSNISYLLYFNQGKF